MLGQNEWDNVNVTHSAFIECCFFGVLVSVYSVNVRYCKSVQYCMYKLISLSTFYKSFADISKKTML